MSAKTLLTIWLASLFLAVPACRIIGADPATKNLEMVEGPRFADGILTAHEKSSFEAVYAAIPKAFSALEIQIVDLQPDRGNVFGRTSDGKFVRIHVSKSASGGADIQIQIPNENEQARTRLILEQIRRFARNSA